jgi:predicted RNA binding protein YcfA (HicA-like mRNA interferase family)
MPLSGKNMVKLFQKAGYEIVKGQGKGSHVKLRKNGIMAIVPNHRELKKGTESALLKQLEATK